MAVTFAYQGKPAREHTPLVVIPVLVTVSAATSDFVPLASVLAGDRVVGGQLSTSGTSSATLSIGDAGSATRFANAASINAAGPVALFNNAPAHTAGVVSTGPNYKYTTAGTIGATVGGAALSNVVISGYLLVVREY